MAWSKSQRLRRCRTRLSECRATSAAPLAARGGAAKPVPMGLNKWTEQTLLAADAGIAPGARGRGEDASEEGAEQAGGLGGRGGAEQAVCVCDYAIKALRNWFAR